MQLMNVQAYTYTRPTKWGASRLCNGDPAVNPVFGCRWKFAQQHVCMTSSKHPTTGPGVAVQALLGCRRASAWHLSIPLLLCAGNSRPPAACVSAVWTVCFFTFGPQKQKKASEMQHAVAAAGMMVVQCTKSFTFVELSYGMASRCCCRTRLFVMASPAPLLVSIQHCCWPCA